MRLLILFLLSGLLHVSAASNAQTITLVGRNITFQRALDAIRTQAGYEVAADRSLLRLVKPVNIQAYEMPVEEFLAMVLHNQPIEAKIEEKTVYLFEKDDPNVQIGKVRSRSSWLQRTISGTVTDEQGTPLEGVTVTVKGMSIVTSTAGDGKFELVVNGLNNALVFSAVGFKAEEITTDGKQAINVTLKSATSDLDEVVVVGFGVQRKISNIGAQSTLKPTELKKPVSDITSMLAGRLSGIVGVQRSGEPGRSGADIFIRGISSFGGNESRPLILVDGVERPINNLDPEDIESFTILKDASGTAVYGARGANGVIVVKTKKGKIGKPSIFFDYNEGVNTFTRLPEMLDGVSYMNLVNEARLNRGQDVYYTEAYIKNTETAVDPLVYPNVDWFDEIFKNFGRNRRANLNVSGGVDNAQYYVSVNYYNETGLLKTDELVKYNSDLSFTRYNVTSNLNLKLSPTTTLDLGLQGYLSNGNYPALSTGEIFAQAMDVSPVEYPVMYPGGFIPGKSANGALRNPYADLTRRGYRNENTNQLFTNLRMTQQLDFLLSGLSATAMFSFDANNGHNITRSKREATWFVDMNNPYNDDGSLNLFQTFTPGGGNYLNYDRENGGTRQFYVEGALNYDQSFRDHRIGALALFYSNDYTNSFAGDFSTSIPERTLGIAGRATYSYKDRYLLEGNFGYNGSELFAPEQRYGFFPSFGLGWVVSNEAFFEPLLPTVSHVKIRYSNGLTGIGKISGRRFAFMDILSDNAVGYGFGSNLRYDTGIRIDDYGVSVRWAESFKQNLGIELNFFGDQLQFIVDLFKEKRSGIFLQRRTSLDFIGLVNSPWGNLGEMNNKGIDGSVQYHTDIGKFNLELRGNATFNKDVLIEDDSPAFKYPWMDRRGSNFLSRWGYQADKLFESQEEIQNSAVPGDKSRVMVGDIKYRDVNEDGLINGYDMVRIGRGDIPALTWGGGFNLGYKNFSFGLLFQGMHQADIVLSGSAIMPFSSSGGVSNAFSIATDRWNVDNPSQDVFYPRLGYGEAENFNNVQASSWWVKDISFVRLKTADLSYTFNQKALNRLGVNGVTVYLQGINLLTFSNFKLWDPELYTTNGSAYPNVKTFVLGLNVKI